MWSRRQKCRCCCETQVVTAPGPVKLVPGGRYSIDLATHVAEAKYLDHMPLERQARSTGRSIPASGAAGATPAPAAMTHGLHQAGHENTTQWVAHRLLSMSGSDSTCPGEPSRRAVRPPSPVTGFWSMKGPGTIPLPQLPLTIHAEWHWSTAFLSDSIPVLIASLVTLFPDLLPFQVEP